MSTSGRDGAVGHVSRASSIGRHLDDCPPSLQPDAVAASGTAPDAGLARRGRARRAPPMANDGLPDCPSTGPCTPRSACCSTAPTALFQTALEGLTRLAFNVLVTVAPDIDPTR